MRKFFCSLPLALIFTVSAVSQGTDLIDMDLDSLDSIFNQSAPQEEPPQKEETASIIDNLRRRGLEFDFSYIFRGAVNPGWTELYPWEENAGDNFTWSPAVSMTSSIGINAQISNSFRVKTDVIMEIPGAGSVGSEDFSIVPNITLGDFYFNYIFLERVFLRAGKFEQPWGISPNFEFTSLLARVPDNGPSGSSYLIKFDIPIGTGGFQILSQTRSNIAAGDIPEIDSIGFGGKYNFVSKYADFNLGAFFQKNMATRAFFTIKTTLWDFEVYNEWLVAFNTHTDNAVSFAGNLGFLKSFFNNKLDLNIEVFYNGEGRLNFFKRETEYDLYGNTPFLDGINAAVNLLYRFSGWGNPRLFARFLYGDDSFSFIPGIRLTPFQNLEIYLALPLAFGNGHYKTEAVNFRGEIKPVSLLLYVTFKGDLRANYYY